MFKSQWWVDLRFQQERRQVFGMALIFLFVTLFVGVIGYVTYQQMREEKAVNLAASAMPAVEVQVAHPMQGLLEKASDMVIKGQFSEANTTLREVESQINRLNAIIAWKTGDTGKAMVAFEQALRINPDSVPDLVNLAGVMLETGRAPEAVNLLKRAQEKAPDDVYVTNRYFLARLQAGDSAGVRKEVFTALEVSPQNSIPTFAVAGAVLEIEAGQFPNAANFLYAARKALPLRIFESLIKEPPVANHRDKLELKPFFFNISADAASQPMIAPHAEQLTP